jgi:hypothetical protein
VVQQEALEVLAELQELRLALGLRVRALWFPPARVRREEQEQKPGHSLPGQPEPRPQLPAPVLELERPE